ncbi:MAG: lipoate--protein ligase family protein [Desulfobacterales bacterium]|jgi:lipoate-protein ligase A|nr:lipoate--protein ligase family protein [Desulfobacterales bacterium]MDP6806329.1 lipoate--protein ligase family protein [Desulfobacterales bacterium]|tara:strand:- start:10499 stop:12076 length:1578 start_codon:yes stop_codon:yes gene_type:complete
MEQWRLLDTPPMSAAKNMALDETLLELKGTGKSPNTLRFLQFSPRTVLVGYHQSIQEEIRENYCRAHNIEINRRITGGGAIFFDENQLGWEVICDKEFFDVVIPNNRLFKTLCLPVRSALKFLGLDATFRPRNDIEINGRKISGTGGTDSDDAFLFQGTMLVDFDVDTMLRSLKIPVEKLKSKEIDSFKDRVTCLNWELGYTPELSDIKASLVKGFETHLGISLITSGLTPAEEELFPKKLKKCQSKKWIDGVKPSRNLRNTVQSAYKAESGMIRYTLAINSTQRRLKDIYITGDFISFPGRALYDLESKLRGLPLKKERLYPIIEDYFENDMIVIPGMSVADFIKPLELALEKIKILDFGIPIEYCNMISVTNGSFQEVIEKNPEVLLLPYCAKLTDCELRYKKGCKQCDEDSCTIGPAWKIGLQKKKKMISITSFEDLWAELMKIKKKGQTSFIGCCCQPFFAKHVDDFTAAGLPGILLDIDNTTCYDLDQAKDAYAGKFESQTQLNLDLLQTVLNAIACKKE